MYGNECMHVGVYKDMWGVLGVCRKIERYKGCRAFKYLRSNLGSSYNEHHSTWGT